MPGGENKLAEGLVLNNWSEIGAVPTLKYLEANVLPAYLPARRWFAGKGRPIADVCVARQLFIPTEGQPSVLWLLRVRYHDREEETYLLPVCFLPERRLPEEQLRPPLLCRVKIGVAYGWLTDATWCEEFRLALFRLFACQGRLKCGENDAVVFQTAPTFLRFAREVDSSFVLRAEQSNTSIVYGRAFILKLYRKLHIGVNPDVEVSRFLCEKAGFTKTPAWSGSIHWATPAGVMDIGILQQLVAGSRECWSEVTTLLKDLLDSLPSPGSVHVAFPHSLHTMADKLGTLTANMHLALSQDAKGSSFVAERLTPAHRDLLMNEIHQQVSSAFELIARNINSLSPATSTLAVNLLEMRSELTHLLGDIEPDVEDAFVMRVHGDFHLGQILVSGEELLVTDFEGEPARPFNERRIKQPPAKDVAGMLRSFHYAVYAAALQGTTKDISQIMPQLEHLYHQMTDAYLAAYRRGLGDEERRLLPTRPSNNLLRVYLLDKVMYELKYELNNRPGWVLIPLTGATSLIHEWIDSDVHHA